MLQGFLILLLSIAAAVCYGVVHDQITARICVEYFTVGHPVIVEGVTDPTRIALIWGVIATWWVGAILGVPLSLAARIGRLPKRDARSLVRPILVVLLAMAACATAAGIYGYAGARNGSIEIPAFVRMRIAPDHHAAFMADAYTHLASYIAGAILGLGLMLWVLWQRRQAEVRRCRDRTHIGSI